MINYQAKLNIWAGFVTEHSPCMVGNKTKPSQLMNLDKALIYSFSISIIYYIFGVKIKPMILQ